MSGPVTEFAILRLKSENNTSLNDPELITGLGRVNSEQSAWSTFPLYWFTYSSDESTFVCILSQWEDVFAHQEWIDSDQNQALLKLLSPKLEIHAFCHIDLHASKSGIELGDVFLAKQLSWRKLTEAERVAGGQGRKGDACGWAVDTPEPMFYVFRVDKNNDPRTEEEVDWTTMSRLLDPENL
ncbi:hypothetical protein RSOLAG1IB_03941 [Rhizoctonia solani AG-1 IB]|uniref:ABM domain-containing protein n=1 Tax=Thanatephorus cucumeris (strain AG1-IB / isolate 7/3/14) TaxID=1108050 RepID=A0A0B7FWZ9_THACB|nr:hypothetical protein RSOLAG1IB_03941 [Rhizoctonia solani AG-1 IB]